jgi:hypothetical protein
MAQGPQNYTALVTTLDGQQSVVNIKILSAASPPDRPQPGPTPPTEPPLGIWGPTDPRPTHPIAGFDPIHGTWPEGPGGPGGGGGGGQPPQLKPPTGSTPGLAAVRNSAESGGTPPADLPDATKMEVYFGQGTLPAQAWVGPYAQTQP